MNCPDEHCDFDSIPICLVKSCASVLIPTITDIVNNPSSKLKLTRINAVMTCLVCFVETHALVSKL